MTGKKVKDLRTYLQDLEETKPDALLKIDKPMKTEYEINALQRKLDNMGSQPVMLVEKPITFEGEISEHKLVTNLTGNRALAAEALGLHPRRIAMDYFKKMDKKIEPVVVDRSEAPVKEKIDRGEEINLWKFPVTTHNWGDPGPYIGSGYVVTTDPETKIDNMALQRIWVKEKNRTGLWPAITGHNYANIENWWAKGEDVPVAVWIGHHPAGLSGAQARLGHPESHYPAMGGALGEPVRLVPSETFGKDLMVPADAEIVIEGYIPKDVFEAEGPFGEYPGYLGPQRPSPVIEVECVTYRKDAIYHNVGVGLSDHLVMLGNFPMEARIYNIVKQVVPEVMNVYVPVSGRRNHVYVQVKKTKPGLGKEVIMATLPCDSRMKHCIVVDEDVDLFNEEDILWSIAYRSQWDQDMVVVKGAAVFPLDPSLPEPGNIGTRGGIDATMPPPIETGKPRHYQFVNKAPKEVDEKIQIEDFVKGDLLDKFPKAQF